ncbi:MAG: hypothetical protein ACTHOJ_10765 [Sphingomonas oligoaromativorans]
MKKLEIGELDVEALRQAKQLARERDDEDLREGRVSAEELRMHNGFFSGLDFSRARIKLNVNRGRKRNHPASKHS